MTKVHKKKIFDSIIILRLLFLSIFILSFSIIFYFNNKNKNALIDIELNKKIKELKINFDITNSMNSKDAKSINQFIKTNTDILNILSKALDADENEKNILRKKLYFLLSNQYIALKTRGVLQIQFMFPDNTSFLRVHKPNKYGDNLEDIRYSFKYTNETHKPTSGFEQGRTSHGFRNVFPIFYHNKYLGCYEISYSSESIQDNLTNINKIHSHFLILKNIFKIKAWKRKDMVLNYIQSIEHKNYMFTTFTNIHFSTLAHSKKYIIKPNKAYIEKNMDNSKEFAFYNKIDDEIKVVAFLPIKNIKNDTTVAYIVSYTKSNYILNILNSYKFINIISFIILAIILFLTYKELIHKKILQKEIQEQITESLKKDKILQEQSKLAAMGEMVGAIAHQWRQPLNALNINIQNLDDDYDEGLIDKIFVDDFIYKQTKCILFMSETIDDFRNFFRVDKIRKKFSIKEAIIKTLSIQEAQLKNFNITTEISGNDFYIENVMSEFQQIILNIISNTKDAIVDKEIRYGKIFIILDTDKVIIRDNAGGIPKEIINRIFEPYFTTKEQGKETGLGLYISKMILEQNFCGNLSAKNIKDGAEFTIDFLHNFNTNNR